MRKSKTWHNMMQRCNYARDRSWKYYGGRGITVCDRWHSYENFLADMGPQPPGLTLGRIDNDKGYSPDNCEWQTWEKQFALRRKGRAIRTKGKPMNLPKTKPKATKADRHPLRRYRKRRDISLFSFAKLCGAKSAATINDLEWRRRKPSFKLAKAIVKVTKGAVSYQDLA